MNEGTYDDETLMEEDRVFVLKKLELTDEAFERYMGAEAVSHLQYPSRAWLLAMLRRCREGLSWVTG